MTHEARLFQELFKSVNADIKIRSFYVDYVTVGGAWANGPLTAVDFPGMHVDHVEAAAQHIRAAGCRPYLVTEVLGGFTPEELAAMGEKKARKHMRFYVVDKELFEKSIAEEVQWYRRAKKN